MRVWAGPCVAGAAGAHIVFGDKRIQAGSQPRNIHLMPSSLKALAIIVPMGCLTEEFIIWKEVRSSRSVGGSLIQEAARCSPDS